MPLGIDVLFPIIVKKFAEGCGASLLVSKLFRAATAIKRPGADLMLELVEGLQNLLFGRKAGDTIPAR